MPVSTIAFKNGVVIPVRDGSRLQQVLDKKDKNGDGVFDVFDIDPKPNGFEQRMIDLGLFDMETLREVDIKYEAVDAMAEAGEIDERQKENIRQFLDTYVAVRDYSGLVDTIKHSCDRNSFGSNTSSCSAKIYREAVKQIEDPAVSPKHTKEVICALSGDYAVETTLSGKQLFACATYLNELPDTLRPLVEQYISWSRIITKGEGESGELVKRVECEGVDCLGWEERSELFPEPFIPNVIKKISHHR